MLFLFLLLLLPVTSCSLLLFVLILPCFWRVCFKYISFKEFKTVNKSSKYIYFVSTYYNQLENIWTMFMITLVLYLLGNKFYFTNLNQPILLPQSIETKRTTASTWAFFLCSALEVLWSFYKVWEMRSKTRVMCIKFRVYIICKPCEPTCEPPFWIFFKCSRLRKNKIN